MVKALAGVKNRLLKYWDAETGPLMVKGKTDHELCDMLMKAAEIQHNHDDADYALVVYESLPPLEYTVEEPVIEPEVHLSTDDDLEGYLQLQTAKEEEVNIVQKLVEAVKGTSKPKFPMHNGLVIVTKKGTDWKGKDVVTTHLVLPENLEAHLEKYEGWQFVTV